MYRQLRLRSTALLLVLFLLGGMWLCWPGLPVQGAETQGVFSNASLSGFYYVHDAIGVLDGSGATARGSRDFNGEGRLSSIITYASLTPLNYEVTPTGSFRVYSTVLNAGFVGSVGLGGDLAVYSPRYAAGQHPQVPKGFAAMQISVRRQAGYLNTDFHDGYSYHALVYRDKRWWNVFGAADADTQARKVTLYRTGSQPLAYAYQVDATGQIAMMNRASAYAVLAHDGTLAFQTVNVNPQDDPLYLSGYDGLAVYVRRDKSQAGFPLASFKGTYRVHELRIGPAGANQTRAGAITTNGNGAFIGTLGETAYNGRIDLLKTGVFHLAGTSGVTGTLGADGEFAVLTPDAGLVDGTTGSAWIQLWIRVAGGPGSDIDTDGDGLTDEEEAALGTDYENPDTDGDGLLDGADARPLVADNVFTATLSAREIEITEGDPSPTPLTLTLDSNDFPFFNWQIASNATWLTVLPARGEGDAVVSVRINATGMNAANTPYVGRLSFAAPDMKPLAPVTFTVNVLPPPLQLETTPEALTFIAVEGGVPSPPQNVALSSPDTTEFQWTATPTDPWLRVLPAQGTGPKQVAVSVVIDGLVAIRSPYQSRVTFAAPATASQPVQVPVTLTILPPRQPGQEFALWSPGGAQADPAIACDTATGQYVTAWAADNVVYAMVLNPTGTPLLNPIEVSLAVQGPAARPAVAIDPAGAAAWIFWEQRTVNETQAALVARVLDLRTLTFGTGITGGLGATSVLHPTALFNPVRREIAVIYNQTVPPDVVRLLRFTPVSGNVLSNTIISSPDFQCEDPHLALDSAGQEYLAVWAEKSLSQSHIRAQRVNAASGQTIGDAFRVEDVSDYQTLPQAAYNSTLNAWSVLWRNGADANAATFTMRLAQFPAGSDTPEMKYFSPAPARAAEGGHALAHAPAGQQSLLLWEQTDAPASRLYARRTTAGGFFLDAPAPISASAGPQRTPRLLYNPHEHEFFAVWRDERNLLSRIYAARLAGGSPDEDDDGLTNDWEFRYGLDPFDPTGGNGPEGDPDQDGLSNLEEQTMHTDPTRADTDEDGLLDFQEDRNRNGIVDSGESSAIHEDTDGDGANDGVEWFLGTNASSLASVPGTAIYRIEYGSWTAGQPGELRVHVFAREAGRFTLELNGGWNPPSGWTATLDGGAATRDLTPGAHVFSLTVTPPAPITVTTAHGAFAFRLTNTAGHEDTLTAMLLADPHQTFAGGSTGAEELARTYAPVVRLHRDEFYLPLPVETTLERAAFDMGNTHPLGVNPGAFNLYQSPQAEARLDLPGTTTQSLRQSYPPPNARPDPVLYYTVITLGSESAEPIPPAAHVSIQYYLHFFADEWGVFTPGAHRHEGDWEVLQILLDDALVPYRVTATQQWQLARDGLSPGSISQAWNDIEMMDDTHPIVYAGAGGHSLYLEPANSRYDQAQEPHDGLGSWLLPFDNDAYLVDTDYSATEPLRLIFLPRLGEPGEPGWLRYAGRWGQDRFPALPQDQPAPSTQTGPPGPAFLGTSVVPGSASGVYSLWTDPYAWAMRSPVAPAAPSTTLRGYCPTVFAGETLVLADARGRVYRTSLGHFDARFEITVPAQNYMLAVAQRDALGRETLLASARFNGVPQPTNLFPAVSRANIDLGTFTLSEGLLVGSTAYSNTDSDGDGVPDAEDDDQDNDSLLNAIDADALGDGWLDQFQQQDPDGDGAWNYYDADDDGDGIPDREDPDADEDGLLDTEEPVDTDGDGFIDAIDLDIDNDGFSNSDETADGSDPRHPFDTPLQRVGDLDRDGDIDSPDARQVIDCALKTAPYTVLADFDLDGTITAYDIQRVLGRMNP